MMTRRQANAGILAGAVLAAAPGVAVAQELKVLPPPRSEGGQSLTAALKLRRSTREYSDRPLPAQVVSDLLWAAFGVNRRANDGRTVPYWRHVMVLDVYLAMADGVWLYEPKSHQLQPHMKEDLRAQTGLQDFVATAPLNLVYVAHGERMTNVTPEDRPPSLRLRRCQLYRAECIFALCFRRARHRLSGRGRWSQARAAPPASGPAVRYLRANGRIS